VNWFAGQYRLKLKSPRPIKKNGLTAGTKHKIEQFFRTFQDLIRSFLLELIFGADETIVKRSDIDGWDWPKRLEFVRRERIGQIPWTRQWRGVSGQENGMSWHIAA
jgi:hypothetical protein